MVRFYLCSAIDWKLLNPLLMCKNVIKMWNKLINMFELKAIENIHHF
jgi:hypothetical protein